MMFNQMPQYVYMPSPDGKLYKARVMDVIMDLTYGGIPEVTIRCVDMTITTKLDMKDVDVDVFQAMLEDGYGTGNSEVQKEVAEETA